MRDSRERRYYWQICGADSSHRNCDRDQLRAPCYLRYHWGRYEGERQYDDVHVQSDYWCLILRLESALGNQAEELRVNS